MIHRVIILTLAIFAMGAGLVFAGDPQPGTYPHPWMIERQHEGPPDQGPPDPQKFERFRMRKLMELLQLDPETAERFRAAWHNHRQEQREIWPRVYGLMRCLKKRSLRSSTSSRRSIRRSLNRCRSCTSRCNRSSPTSNLPRCMFSASDSKAGCSSAWVNVGGWDISRPDRPLRDWMIFPWIVLIPKVNKERRHQ